MLQSMLIVLLARELKYLARPSKENAICHWQFTSSTPLSPTIDTLST